MFIILGNANSALKRRKRFFLALGLNVSTEIFMEGRFGGGVTVLI